MSNKTVSIRLCDKKIKWCKRNKLSVSKQIKDDLDLLETILNWAKSGNTSKMMIKDVIDILTKRYL